MNYVLVVKIDRLWVNNRNDLTLNGLDFAIMAKLVIYIYIYIKSSQLSKTKIPQYKFCKFKSTKMNSRNLGPRAEERGSANEIRSNIQA